MAVGRVNLLSDVGHRQAKFLLVFWGAYHTTDNKNRKMTVCTMCTTIQHTTPERTLPRKLRLGASTSELELEATDTETESSMCSKI